MKKLEILSSAIKELDLSQNTLLKELIVSSDELKELDLSQNKDSQCIWTIVNDLKTYYYNCIEQCSNCIEDIKGNIPKEWNVSTTLIEEKLTQLTNPIWVNDVWDNFVEC